jgi:hypothetical protein
VWQSFQKFEYQLRSDVSAWRSSGENEGEVRPSGFPVSVLREGNPLETEKRLLKIRWDLLDEAEKSHHFDLGFLVIYYLKLQILQMLSRFDKEKGKDRFHRLVYETSLAGQDSGVKDQANQGQEE